MDSASSQDLGDLSVEDDMADTHPGRGILRYLIDIDFVFLEVTLGDPTNRFDYNFELIARDAMTKAAQTRFATKLPRELRLKVMKYSVLYHLPTKLITARNTTNDLSEAATELYSATHITGMVLDVLKQTAEQALVETAIFKVRAQFDRPGMDLYGHTLPLLDNIAARIQHLEISMECNANLDGTACSTITAALQTLRVRFTNLKACIITLDIWSCRPRTIADSRILDATGTTNNFPLVQTPQMVDDFTFPLQHILVELFEAIAYTEPGARLYIRFRHLWIGGSEEDNAAECHFGPIVPVTHVGTEVEPQAVPGGTAILEQAYRVTRMGHRIRYAA